MNLEGIATYKWAFRKAQIGMGKIFKQMKGNPSGHLTLSGDRDVEYSWILSNLGKGPGKVLDVGCGPYSHLGLVSARLGYQVTAIDLKEVKWPYEHPGLTFRQGDILQLGFEPSSFDVILNCSSIEHIGLPGRYGMVDKPDGDFETMDVLKKLLKPGGIMILTIPVGQDEVIIPFHRIYGKARLPKLLESWWVQKKEYWVKNNENRWALSDEENVLGLRGSASYYGLGLFVLSRLPGR